MPAGSAWLGGDMGAAGPGRLLPRPCRGVGGQDTSPRLGRAGAGGICLGGCCLREELLGASGFNQHQLVKSRGQLQVN